MVVDCMKKRQCTNTHNVLSTSDRNTQYSPDTLLKLCIEFVAQNLLLVESFYGFPDLIGKEIFKSAEYHRKFDGTSSTFHQEIALFTVEYGEEVLSQLNVSGCHLGINYFLESVLLFNNLTAVDLSACGLGDDHELLYHIGKMNCLKQISLKDNAMSDCGIQKMTTPLRMFKPTGTVLNILDISENAEITPKCLKYLNCYPHLQSVEVTGTMIDMRMDVVDDCWKVQHHENILKHNTTVTTEGWAESVVSSWMSLAVVKLGTDSRKTTGAAKFYASSRRKQIQSPEIPKSSKQTNNSKKTILVRSIDSTIKTNTKTCLKEHLSLNKDSREITPVGKPGQRQTKPVKCDGSGEKKGVRNKNITSSSSATDNQPYKSKFHKNSTELSEIDRNVIDAEILKQYASDSVQLNKQSSLWTAMNSSHW